MTRNYPSIRCYLPKSTATNLLTILQQIDAAKAQLAWEAQLRKSELGRLALRTHYGTDGCRTITKTPTGYDTDV